METLMVVAQHQNQSYSRNRSQISDRFGSSPSRGFKGINCRTFESGTGVPPSPPAVFPPFSSPPGAPKQSRWSSPIPIATKPSQKETTFSDDLSCSELWAGPAYSNSPPPSSLPIPKFSLCQKPSVSLELPVPKFSLRQKRSVSLELPTPPLGITLDSVAKSAPPSPTRESGSLAGGFFLNTTSATENLRRILNLDIADDRGL